MIKGLNNNGLAFISQHLLFFACGVGQELPKWIHGVSAKDVADQLFFGLCSLKYLGGLLLLVPGNDVVQIVFGFVRGFT